MNEIDTKIKIVNPGAQLKYDQEEEISLRPMPYIS